jgi:hypothetical protein
LNKEHRKFGHEIFLDRTHGKSMSAMLRRAGFTVHHIFEVYPNKEHETIEDPVWIKMCGEKGWIAVSGDKRLETVPENRQAVIESKLKAFILTDSNSKPEVWAAAIIVGHFRMDEIIDGNNGPFFVNVGKRSDGHVARLRLPPGYTAPDEESDSPAIGTLVLTAPVASS